MGGGFEPLGTPVCHVNAGCLATGLNIVAFMIMTHSLF